jgi:hypothetical protein
MITLFLGQTQAAIIKLDVLDHRITAGDTFDVAVWLDGENIGEPLLAFGFDVFTSGESFSYMGYTVGNGFLDFSVPYNPNNVAGAGLGFTDDLLLATLTFNADKAGTQNLAVAGSFDGLFYGLFYEFSGYDIQASTEISVVPLPSSLSLLAIGLFGLGMTKRRNRDSVS